MKNKLHLYCDIQCPHCKKNSDKILRAIITGCVQKYYECPFCKTKIKINPRYRMIKTILFLLVVVVLWVPSGIVGDWLWVLMGGDLAVYSQGHSGICTLVLYFFWTAICTLIHIKMRSIPWAADITTEE
ncbi:MAG: hypothetical protein R3Y06_01135 [Faecalibacterium sp.]